MKADDCRFEVTPLGNGIAAEIRGVDVRRIVSQGDLATIEKLVAEHHVIVFRDQTLSEEEQVAFTRAFGDDWRQQIYDDENDFKLPPIETPTRGEARHRGKFAMYGTYGPEFFDSGVVTGSFHADTSYMETPLCYTFLYAIEAAEKGGYTQFASQSLAYDALGEETRHTIAPLQATFTSYVARLRSAQLAGERIVRHPVVRTHPVTGRRCLFVNRGHTVGIENMDPRESEQLLKSLYDIAEDPGRVWTHDWNTGDLLMFDNRNTIHRPFQIHKAVRRITRQTSSKLDTGLH